MGQIGENAGKCPGLLAEVCFLLSFILPYSPHLFGEIIHSSMDILLGFSKMEKPDPIDPYPTAEVETRRS